MKVEVVYFKFSCLGEKLLSSGQERRGFVVVVIFERAWGCRLAGSGSLW
jgi:hypothetical protein